MKTFKEFMNIRPDRPRRRNGDAPLDKPAPPDLSDISPYTLQLLQLFSSQSGQIPKDPEDHHGIKAFRGWSDQIQELVISDLVDLANQAPNPELKISLTNMEKFLRLMRGK